MWSDEVKVKLFGSNDVKWVNRPVNEAFNPKFVLPTVKHGGGSIMLHGVISSDGVGKLTLVQVSY